MAGPTENSAPILVGIVLTSVGFMVNEEGFLNVVWLALLAVGTRTYVILARRQAAGRPGILLSAFLTLMTSAALTLAIADLLIVVIFITAVLKESNVGPLPLAVILFTPTYFIILIARRWRAYAGEFGSIKLDWLYDFEFRPTIRGMLVGVAFIAFALWEVHHLWMRPTYIAIANHEAFLAGLCLAESQTMAERAERCHERAADGVDWKLNDQASEDLKLCPFSNRSLGRSWLEQAEIWKSAAERCREAARRHDARSTRYRPWFESSKDR
ncbi:hypothetical protein [Singulisphaera sp. PoT]|uniref:hypothetical protein n=1 Tax=Singulisphaera sp. PoT TaxID=3411797 RepID=UPI003BF5BE4C